MLDATTHPEVTMTFLSPRHGRDGQPATLEMPRRTLGMDLGDRKCDLCLLDEAGQVLRRDRVATTRENLQCALLAIGPSRVVMEVGTHSPWISRLAESLGHDVVVANPRKVQLIAQGARKNDRKDAELLARLGRADTELLSPIRHRGEDAQRLLLGVRQREGLVCQRVALINEVRGLVKSLGERVQSCTPGSFPQRARENLPRDLSAALEPTLACIEEATRRIRELDKVIANPPEPIRQDVERLQQIAGVGPVLSLTFVLTIDDPHRFAKSREVGPFLGLVPRQDQSGGVDKQLPISKAGNPYLRKLLVNSGHYILNRGPETHLKEFGRRLESRGGRAPRKRAVVAVARKLAITMHRMWVTGEDYRPGAVSAETGVA